MPIMRADDPYSPGSYMYVYVDGAAVFRYIRAGWELCVPEPVPLYMRLAYVQVSRVVPVLPDPPEVIEVTVTDEPPDLTCAHCAHYYGDEYGDESTRNRAPWYDDTLCARCNENTTECYVCDTRVDRYTTTYVDNGERMCRPCWERYGYYCDVCDRHFDSRDYTCDCDGDQGGLHDYTYKPIPLFHYVRDNNQPHADSLRRDLVKLPFMGFELEMERRNGPSIGTGVDLVERMWGDFAYCKHDGSLDDGLELVTHPFTLEYANAFINWDLIEQLRKAGFRSWNTSTCGMHVHINRSTFTTPAHLFRFHTLVYRNEDQCKSFSGRDEETYASFSDGWLSANERAKIVKGMGYGSRGAINLQGGSTVEVRMFRGSLRVQRVRANLEFVHAAVEYTRQITVPDVVTGGLSWRAFATWILDNRSMYPHLYGYLDLAPAPARSDLGA